MPAVMRTVVDVVAAVALVCGAASARSLPSFRSADRLIGWSEECAPLLCADAMSWLAEGSALVGFWPALCCVICVRAPPCFCMHLPSSADMTRGVHSRPPREAPVQRREIWIEKLSWSPRIFV